VQIETGLHPTAALMLLAGGPLGYCYVKTTQLGAAFDKVKAGEAERDVVAKMGPPHQVRDGCGYYGRPVAGCAREYLYFPPLTVVGEAWTISLNANGAVIHTAHFVSP
jgi:hypothetical protein